MDPVKGDHKPHPEKRRTKCEHCGHLRYDVRKRPDAFQREIHGDKTATHTVCDWCDQENREDI